MRSAVLAAVALCAACAKDPTYAMDATDATDGGAAVASACPAVDAAVGVEAGGAAADAGVNCSSSCDFAGGIAVGCATRFQYGINFAWDQFAGDFGGVSAWGAPGVSHNGRVRLRARRYAGARGRHHQVVGLARLPRRRRRVCSAGMPLGLGGTTLADVEMALALAAETGIHIQFCMFSFDNFKPDRMLSNGRLIRGIRSIVLDDAKRAALMATAVRPFVRAVSASPHAARAVAWDVINEPEWAISGSDAYGDVAFTPQTHAGDRHARGDGDVRARHHRRHPRRERPARHRRQRGRQVAPGVVGRRRRLLFDPHLRLGQHAVALQRLRERARPHGQAGGDG